MSECRSARRRPPPPPGSQALPTASGSVIGQRSDRPGVRSVRLGNAIQARLMMQPPPRSRLARGSMSHRTRRWRRHPVKPRVRATTLGREAPPRRSLRPTLRATEAAAGLRCGD